MDKLTHTPADVEHMLAVFEETYGMGSEEFYALHRAGRSMEVPRFDRHVWASFFRDFRRVAEPVGEFAMRAEESLALAG